VHIPFRGSQGPLHLLTDSIGIKGEDEWNTRKHDGQKRRVWRNIHIRIDEQTLEVRVVTVTSNDVGYVPILPELLNQIPLDHEIASVTADGAYDTRKATMQVPNVALLMSATRYYGRRNTWALRFGDDRVDKTAEPRRNENALCEAVFAMPYGARLRSSGRGVPGSGGRLERLHPPRHPRHEGRGIGPPGRRGISAVKQFAQYSHDNSPFVP
jgi:hypothetical protein